ncbi:MAG: heat-inducible transcription repressor HrcA [Candidatus Omnitrophica bacterium]|nr:heat-inducible transcription repressor HrcA [Candidatus Omnitrophota bacterium]
MRLDVEQRREKILRIIINNYITSGAPVSSRSICKKYKIGLCPASVRNIMAELEDRHLITHLHTSAGRIPTDKGYRYYVDRLVQSAGLTPEEQANISKEYLVKQLVFEEVVRKTSRVLSDFTNYAGVVSQPEIKKTCFKRIQFTLLNQKKVCVTLITNTGITRTSVVNFELKIDQEKIKKIQNFMNANLENVPLINVKTKLRKMMIQERNAFFHVLKQSMEMIDSSAIIDEKMHFYLEGLSNFVNLSEFDNSDMVRSLIKLLDEKITLTSLVREVMQNKSGNRKIRVFIGKENPHNFMNNCTIVLGTYEIDNQIIGGLGIIGPKRMDYGKAIATVEYVSGMLSEALNQFVI